MHRLLTFTSLGLLAGCANAFMTAALIGPALAQDRGTLDPKPLPALSHPDDTHTAARDIFGRETTPTGGAPHAIGFYSKGCLAGGKELPIDGPTWQVMRLSRNRNWGHPSLISFIERLSRHAAAASHWPGLLIGDMSQPRGGPMLKGHASHQIGLDVDIWMRPMPQHRLLPAEREEMMSLNMVREDRRDVDKSVWTPDHAAVLKAAAQDPIVERIFVNPAIKKALCRDVSGDRSWLAKVRPYYGHDYHFHVRIACPDGEASCKDQDSVPDGIGCDASLDWWFQEGILHPRPSPHPPKPRPPLTLSDLPPACRGLVFAR